MPRMIPRRFLYTRMKPAAELVAHVGQPPFRCVAIGLAEAPATTTRKISRRFFIRCKNFSPMRICAIRYCAYMTPFCNFSAFSRDISPLRPRISGPLNNDINIVSRLPALIVLPLASPRSSNAYVPLTRAGYILHQNNMTAGLRRLANACHRHLAARPPPSSAAQIYTAMRAY